MFLLVALTIWTAMNAYVLWRVHGVVRRVPAWLIAAAGVFLASSYIAARILGSVMLEWIGAVWMGTVVIAIGCFVIADGLALLLRTRAGAIRRVALAATIVLVVAALLNAQRSPVIREHEVRMAALPGGLDGTVVVAISDLHLGAMTSERWVRTVVARVEAQHPDLVLIAGDLSEGHGYVALPRFHAPLGVWAVPGNHEPHPGGGDAGLQKAGIVVLRDASTEVAPGLFVAGVDTVGHMRVPGRGLVDHAIAGVPRGAAVIVLSHYPEQVEKAARAGAGLMIAGHTHAGQIWPFNYFVRMAYRYLGGRYEVEDMPLIVCRGTGTWGPPMRLFYPNEMLRIVLRSGTTSPAGR